MSDVASIESEGAGLSQDLNHLAGALQALGSEFQQANAQLAQIEHAMAALADQAATAVRRHMTDLQSLVASSEAAFNNLIHDVPTATEAAHQLATAFSGATHAATQAVGEAQHAAETLKGDAVHLGESLSSQAQEYGQALHGLGADMSSATAKTHQAFEQAHSQFGALQHEWSELATKVSDHLTKSLESCTQEIEQGLLAPLNEGAHALGSLLEQVQADMIVHPIDGLQSQLREAIVAQTKHALDAAVHAMVQVIENILHDFESATGHSDATHEAMKRLFDQLKPEFDRLLDSSKIVEDIWAWLKHQVAGF